MLTRKIVLSLGLAFLIPALLYRGFELVRPRPAPPKFVLLQVLSTPTAEEISKARAEQRKLQDKQEADQKRWVKTYIWVSIPLGIVLTMLGSLVLVPGLSGGLMLGGSFTFLKGYAMSLTQVGRLEHFLVILAALSALLWIGLKSFKAQQAKQNTVAS